MTDQINTPEKIETQSAILKKTDLDFRRRFVQSVIDRGPRISPFIRR